MKAVVVDIKGRNAIVLSKDGRFIKLKNTGAAEIGSEIDLPVIQTRRINGFFMKGVAAAAVFAITFGYGVYSYSMPYSYINVDINPSMEIVANRYDRVLNVEAINEDGAKLLDNHNYKNKTIDFAIEEIISSASSLGYIRDDDSSAVMLTVSSKNEDKVAKVEKKIQEAAKADMASENVKADIIVESVTIERHDEARELDISPGKLMLIEKLQGIAPDINVEDYKNSPVKDIMKAINEQKKEDKSTDNPQDKINTNDNNEKNNGKNKDSKDNDKNQNKSDNKNNTSNNGKQDKNDKQIVDQNSSNNKGTYNQKDNKNKEKNNNSDISSEKNNNQNKNNEKNKGRNK